MNSSFILIKKGAKNMFDLFKKNQCNEELSSVNCAESEIVAPANATLVALEDVDDEVFSEKIMGDGIAFKLQGDEITVCSPVDGKLNLVFDTGHAFAITTNNGIEILIHIGIDTVKLQGDGFKILNRKIGETIHAGEPVIRVELKKIRKKYDTTTMLIVSNDNGHKIQFVNQGEVKRGQVIASIK